MVTSGVATPGVFVVNNRTQVANKIADTSNITIH
jgi:hypothetical protein